MVLMFFTLKVNCVHFNVVKKVLKNRKSGIFIFLTSSKPDILKFWKYFEKRHQNIFWAFEGDIPNWLGKPYLFSQKMESLIVSYLRVNWLTWISRELKGSSKNLILHSTFSRAIKNFVDFLNPSLMFILKVQQKMQFLPPIKAYFSRL